MKKGTLEELKKLKNMRGINFIFIIVLFFLMFIISGCDIINAPANSDNNQIQSQTNPATGTQATLNYYDDLEKQCQTKPGANCCLNSVARMRAGNFKLEEEGGCPIDYEHQMLLCQDTLIWCQPAK